ncbi:MAG: hypothetical protein MN733_19455, partial [Nitrososphaera sp.]|nr:hypothetical protein [Nitrososphaera sp.]
MNKPAVIAIAVAAVAVPLGIYTISPLFTNTQVDEPIPDGTSASVAFGEFMKMSEEERRERGGAMSPEEKKLVMAGAAQSNSTVEEAMVDGAADT